MKIPVFYIPKIKSKKYLYIERKYVSNQKIISIGSDCHPAFSLQKLNIRNLSLPFDWLNTDPIKGINFVNQNLNENFKYFLHNLHKNKKGHIVSERFPYAEFIHEKNLIENISDQNKFKRRIKRLIQIINTEKIAYLYTIPSEYLDSTLVINNFSESVLEFIKNVDPSHGLYIYIRFDESLNENSANCNLLIKLLSTIDNVHIAKYIRYKNTYGIWGNEKDYIELFKSLGIKLTQTLPKLYIK